jgi:gamma-glutamylcyclotransferase
MDWNQMRQRCPSARFMAIAILRNHRLAFTRRSVRRGCGVADAVAEAGAQVWGVVYEIAEPDIDGLDTCEGFRPGRTTNSYHRRECIVSLDGDDTKPLAVATYFAERQVNPPRPNAEYKNLIVAGARYWHLPDEYVCELEQIEVNG